MLEILSPSHIWGYFEEITQTPRPSKKEGKILNYLKEFALKNSLEYKSDTIGNIVIYAPATAGYEAKEPIILQSHVDMVCEKNEGVNIDFENDALDIFIEDGWVKARGTTLGADCGIGMAVAMAVLTDKTIAHPPIEALFTVDEETGLTGAKELDFSMLSGKKLINLDSEDEGELFVGCAGGRDTIGYFDLKFEDAPVECAIIDINISGLKGGHSGDDINKGRASSVVLLSRILFTGFNLFNINLIDVNAGGLRNAIARNAVARITINKESLSDFQQFFSSIVEDIKKEYHRTEPDMSIEYKVAENGDVEKVVERETFLGVITAVFTLPCGVMAMSQDIEGFVETSTNVASIKIEGQKIVVTTSQRSSLESKRDYTAAIVSEILEGCGAEVEHSDGYPGWSPNANSELLKIFENSYQSLFGKPIKVKAVHAGLECGLFSEKCEGLDMVSVGPTMRDVHSPFERVEIATVEKFWNLLVDVLKF
ncbi:MAG: aminoacyl-histidine dipeptidase [Rikenellaceae bacterium]